MTSNWVDFASVKQAVTIAAVLQRYQIQGLKKHGAELRGRCPIHKGEGQESFHANVEKNCFQCFSCGRRGNVLDFVAAMEGCGVRDAGLKLQDWFGLVAGNTAQAFAPATCSELVREERGGERREKNKPLGFELRGIDYGHAYLASRGITKETAQYFGVGFFSGKGSVSGRCVIPIHSEKGELVAYAGRSVDSGEPKYKLPVGFHKAAELYNLQRAMAIGERGLIVVEGFFDCIKVHQAGYPFVVALMGCSMSEEQERLLVGAADMVLLMLDGDEAGRKGTDEILLRLGRRLWVKSVGIPEGLQPDQMTDGKIQELLKK
jgi:DNA primase